MIGIDFQKKKDTTKYIEKYNFRQRNKSIKTIMMYNFTILKILK